VSVSASPLIAFATLPAARPTFACTFAASLAREMSPPYAAGATALMHSRKRIRPTLITGP